MPNVGYNAQDGTGLTHEILASSDFQMISITIDSSAVDTTNPSGTTTDLRRGLMMAPDSSVGDRYTELDLALAASSDVIVLAENVFSINDGNQVAKAYYKGTFKPDVLFDDSGTTLTHFAASDNQRLSIRPDAP